MATKLILPAKISSLVRLDRFLHSADFKESRFFILLDENSYNNCLPELIASVSALQEAEFIELPVGEDAKSLEIVAQVWQSFLESGVNRGDVIVNLGGGCVTDAGGFIAAAYKRGIRFVNVPTTLLGMVDAAIGGKTAVNMADVKNPVGFFHLPTAVCIHLPFLSTLPSRELLNGTFELLKTLMLSDSDNYHRLLDSMSVINSSEGYFPESFVQILEQMVPLAVAFKSSVVRSDVSDKGIRQMLNLGHTFGHAIEVYNAKQQHYSHGEAVAIGMICALYLSVKKMGFPDEEFLRFRTIVSRLVRMPHYSLRDTEDLLQLMRNDKKNAHEQILAVLMQDIAVPVIQVALDENEIRDCLLNL